MGVYFFRYLIFVSSNSGCSLVQLSARREIGGSNPLIPTLLTKMVKSHEKDYL